MMAGRAPWISIGDILRRARPSVLLREPDYARAFRVAALPPSPMLTRQCQRVFYDAARASYAQIYRCARVMVGGKTWCEPSPGGHGTHRHRPQPIKTVMAGRAPMPRHRVPVRRARPSVMLRRPRPSDHLVRPRVRQSVTTAARASYSFHPARL